MPSRLLLVLASLLAFLGACKQSGETFGPAERTRSDNTYVFGGGAEPESIDPGLAYDSPGLEIARNVFEGLMRYDPATLEPLPGVARSWERSEDGTRYLFHLRPDARWSNGRPVTAHDFVYAWRRVLDPRTAAQYAALLWDLENGKAFAEGKAKAEEVGVRALDENTLEVQLAQPVPWFLDLLAFAPFYPVPEETIRAHGIRWTRPENIVTNGPFHLANWRISYEIELEKSPTYWGRDEVAIDRAVAVISDDNHAMVRLFKAGELDWLGADNKPPVEYLSFLEGKRDYRKNPELATYFYWLNVRTDTPAQRASPVQDERVRQALNLAIDKQALVDFVTRGGERAARTLVPDLFEPLGYEPPQAPDHDPAAARRLLAEAGYGPGGNPFPQLTLTYNTDDRHKQVAEAIQQMWKKELGIDVALENQEWKVFMNNRTEGYFEIARAGWTGDFQDPYTFLSMFLSDSELNEAKWKNATYDRLVNEALTKVDDAERYALYAKAEAILLEEAPILPLYFYSKQTLIGGWVKGLHPNSQGIHPLRDIRLER
ncbi:peptide ABC transporter substrate-binding protein [Vulgatibacter sp.]|uniref:peptide ABC transporter substrate-binding protein n=1 Tax=Vulgatibacter sp. TaxID=1971226 RepID=UPI00356AB993